MLDFGFYNMDCMEGMKQFPDQYFDLAIVDPPYGIGVNKMNLGSGKRKIYRGSTDWDATIPKKEYFEELFRVSKNQIIWGGNYYASFLPDSQCWVCWDKEKPEGVSFADIELAWASFNTPAKIFHFAWNGAIQGNTGNKEYKIHPTQKPIALYDWLLNKYAKPGDKILDTHVGSASSLIACHRNQHKFVGFEIDKTYYDLAKKRLDSETAQMNIFDFMGNECDKNSSGNTVDEKQNEVK